MVVVAQTQQPDCPPVISSFTANPSYVQCGQSVVLTWNVTDASSITISPTIGAVSSGSGSYTVTPSYTITYTLTATNSDGTVNASTTVTVAPYVSAFNSGSEIASAETGNNAGNGSIFTLGLGSENGPVNPLLYILLIGLLAVAAVGVIVFLVRRPVAAASGANAGTRAGHLPWTTTTRVADGTPQTTPVDTGPGPKFVVSDGGSIPISGDTGTLGRSDFRSLVKADKADLISREHLQFDCEDGEYYIEDRKSTNGTKINGKRISGKGRFLLKEGDKIELADALTLTFNT